VVHKNAPQEANSAADKANVVDKVSSEAAAVNVEAVNKVAAAGCFAYLMLTATAICRHMRSMVRLLR
jgi:hypothetical protein